MSHVYHEVSADGLGYLREALEVDGSRISRSARNDELGAYLLSLLFNRVVVDPAVVVNTVGNEVEILARDIYGRAVGEVSAVVEAHAHNGVAGLEQREVYRGVSLCARVGLNVRELCAEQLAGAVDSYLLDNIDALAAAVVALCGVALCVLICKDASHRSHNSGGNDIFARDKFEISSLSCKLVLHRLSNGGVNAFNEAYGVQHLCHK